MVKGKQILNVIHERGKEPVFHATKFVAGNYHGTGDVFAAVIAASMVRGVPMEEAVRRAAAFTKKLCGKDRRTWCPGAGRTVPGGVSVLFDEVELNIMGQSILFCIKKNRGYSSRVGTFGTESAVRKSWWQQEFAVFKCEATANSATVHVCVNSNEQRNS